MSGASRSHQLHDDIDRWAVELNPQLIAARHHLHQHPELSNREVGTAAYVAEALRGYGLDEVRTGIAGHGVVGILRGDQPGERIVALRADMDALPVREESGVDFASSVVDEDYPGGPFPVAHACGHDCHTATVLTAAGVLARVRDRLPGTVVFIFQPAEEGPPVGEAGGARAMLESGALDDVRPSFVFGMHVSALPKGTVAYSAGTMYAGSCLVKITVTGQQIHASTPWLGVDPMPAAAGVITGLGQIYRQVPGTDAVAVSIGHVDDVGRFNIIGETVTLWGTIRTLTQGTMAAVQERLRRLVEHQAAAYGCTGEVEYLQPVEPVVNASDLVEAVLPTLERVVGREALLDQLPPVLGYDDVSEFLNAFGGVYFSYGVQDTRLVPGQPVPVEPVPGGRGMAPNHSPRFYADDDCLLDSLRIHVHVAVDRLLAEP